MAAVNSVRFTRFHAVKSCGFGKKTERSPIFIFDANFNKYYPDDTSEAIHHLNGNVTVTIHLTDEQITQITDPSLAQILFYDSETDTFTNMNASFDIKNKTATFTTDHFSTYVLAVSAGATTGNTENNPNTGMDSHYPAVLFVLLGAGFAAGLVIKKHIDLMIKTMHP
jgi:hypothetical protein